MKFGQTIESSAKELPEEWQPYIIQYNLLKKNIKSIVEELDSTFRSLNLHANEPDNEPAHAVLDNGCFADTGTGMENTAGAVAVQKPKVVDYHIEKDSDGIVHPVITVKICKQSSNRHDQIVELPDMAGLPNNTSILLPRHAETLSEHIDAPAPLLPRLVDSAGKDVQTRSASDSPASGNILLESSLVDVAEETQITVRLQADQIFFDQLINYIERTRAFEKSYTQQYTSNVSSLGAELTFVTSPFKHDFQIWREIFRLYMDAEVWSHNEGDTRPTNTAKEGQERFAKFTKHIEAIGLAKRFRDPLSAKLLMSFYKLNSELTYMKLLQEMNELATRKIIKKHDKRTQLIAKTQFPQLVAIDPTTLARALIFTVYNELVAVVPQIDDYLCPMCLSIAWRPLRLECMHVFCSRCVVKASRNCMFNCPVCRCKDAIYNASVANIDQALLNFLKLYFPKEIKEKQREIQHEITEEETGAILSLQSRSKPCIVM
ncbi:hypothetical protein GGI02_001779 [Coemansia sp. RSA 2322]|uniref:SPX domain-containing protein n=1 Tax=Coemansia thaxteri TaxID=2663907 RepID=A0A9W8EJI8_9FUNG|nr:hypothetical protein H4R26_002422 [Coemansia thaxteri]KAJ2472149.1 hypothetical protein GGI02_001779 [Coemansia sp. RSA 2322]